MTASTMVHLLIMLCSLVAWIPYAGAQAAPSPLDVPALMELMSKVSKRDNHFTETKTLAMLTRPLVLSGTLSYVRPNRVEKHVTSPYIEHLVVEGDQLTLSTKDGTKRIAVDSHSLIRSLIEAIRASLAGQVAVLRRLYHIKLDGTLRNWTLTLRPLDAQAAEYLQSVTLTGQGDRLIKVDIRETGGDRSLMEIHEPVS